MSTRPFVVSAALLLAACAGTGSEFAAPGEKIYFERCRTCHSIVRPDGETVVRGGEIGPNHWGVIGRQAGAQTFAHYGRDIVAAGERGLVWTEAEVAQYLVDPRLYLRAYLDDPKARSMMAFRISSEKDRRDVAAYLATMR